MTWTRLRISHIYLSLDLPLEHLNHIYNCHVDIYPWISHKYLEDEHIQISLIIFPSIPIPLIRHILVNGTVNYTVSKTRSFSSSSFLSTPVLSYTVNITLEVFLRTVLFHYDCFTTTNPPMDDLTSKSVYYS